MSTLTILADKTRYRQLIIQAVVMICLTVICLFLYPSHFPLAGLLKIVAMFGLLLYGLGLGYFTAAYFSTQKILLEINEQGFIDRSTAVAAKVLIPWQAVKSLSIRETLGLKYIQVSLNDPNLLLSQQSFWKNIYALLNQRLGYALINISLEAALNVQPDEVLQRMQAYQAQALTKP